MALRHSPEVESCRVGERAASTARSKTLLDAFPTLDVLGTHSYAWYDAVPDAVRRTTLAAEGEVTLFGGGVIWHGLRRARENMVSARWETEKARESVWTEVTALFLGLAMDKEAVSMCESRIALLREQESLIARKVELGAAVQGDLLGVQADITSARADLAAAMQERDMDKIALCAAMGVEDWASFDILTEADEAVRPESRDEAQVLLSAMDRAQIQAQDAALAVTRRDVQLAKARHLPTVSLSYGVGLGVRENAQAQVALNLSIPLAGHASTAKDVQLRRLALRQAELACEAQRIAWGKAVRQALVQERTAQEKFLLLEADVAKYAETLRQTQQRYASGAATYNDCQMAMGNLFQAELRRLQSKYEYRLRSRLVDFYAEGCGGQ